MSFGTPTIVFVGAGPRSTSLVERLAASAHTLLQADRLEIHLVDPFPPGGGRIWRRAQSPLLWMNSVAADVTMFTDSSVQCEGPHRFGPTLAQWVVGEGRQILSEAGLADVVDTFEPTDFPSRELQSHYLAWVLAQAVADLPAAVSVHSHLTRAVQVVDLEPSARQLVVLEDGREILADVVVLAQGYLDREPTAREESVAQVAAHRGLTYVGPSYTADLDLSDIRPGEDVLVRGMGLAFIDLMVLLGEQRGGKYVQDAGAADGVLTYLPSGNEPVLHVGSRRGVPYHSKLGYVNLGAAPAAPHYFTTDALDRIFRTTGTLDYQQSIFPLLVKELAYAHYRELFGSHRGRVQGSWQQFAELIDQFDPRSPEFLASAADLIPDPRDRFDLAVIDRPLAGQEFTDSEQLAQQLTTYISDDLTRRANPAFSQDLAVFNALLTVYGVLGQSIAAGRVSASDRVSRIEGELHGLFSFIASGPPPERLSQLLALHRAGLVHFVGAEMEVEVGENGFQAWSPAVPGKSTARVFIEARLPKPDVPTALDPVIKGLLASGELAVESVAQDISPSLRSPHTSGGATANAAPVPGGQLLADEQCRAKRADGTVHQRRFLLGPSVSGSAGASGFSRPHYNSPFLRQNDSVARAILGLINTAAAELHSGRLPAQQVGSYQVEASLAS